MIETTYHLSCPISFALLADFHNTAPEPVLASLRQRKPEMICVAGDFINGSTPEKARLKIQESKNALKMLRCCAELAPTFVSFGNHEYRLCDEDIAAIRATGITLLDNEWSEFQGIFIGGQSSAIFSIFQKYRKSLHTEELYPPVKNVIQLRRTPPELAWLDTFEQLDGYKLFLCHHPEYYPRYLRNRSIDLICSGHCHGGQWRYYSPIHHETRGVYAPGQGLFPSLTSGVHDNRLVISRGLSNPTFIPRLNNPTELIYILPE